MLQKQSIGRMINKQEYGSEFDYPINSKWNLDNTKDSIFNDSAFSLFFSGRSALYHLLDMGIKTHSWKQIYLPSYYCHEVTAFLKPLALEIHYYDYNPLSGSEIDFNSILDTKSSVFVNVNFFSSIKLDISPLMKATIVDDITHHLLSYKTSSASYCFGSLRKELPVPLGGFCFSPSGLTLPIGTTNKEAVSVTESRIKAMLTKKQYLDGVIASKNEFRDVFSETEDAFDEVLARSAMPEIAKEILFSLDVPKLLKQKQVNLKAAFLNLQDVDKKVFKFENYEDVEYFALILFCSSAAQRNALKKFLISNSVYPAILWPNQLNERDSDVESRVLFLHMDFRYSEGEIITFTNLVKKYFLYE